MTHMRRAVSRDMVLGAIAAVLIIFAVVYYVKVVRTGGASSKADIWMHCQACKADIAMSEVDVDRMMDKREFQSPQRGMILFKCPKCSQYQLVRGTDPSAPAAPPPTE